MNYCCFIGPPRCGSTIVAAILDCHKNISIANELKIPRLISHNKDNRYIINEILNNLKYHFSSENKIFQSYLYFIPNGYQGKTKQEDALLIGTKMSGLDTRWLSIKNDKDGIDNIELLKSTMKMKIYFIYVIRNPFDCITSMHIMNKNDIESNIYYYFKLHNMCNDIIKRNNTVIYIYYEQFVKYMNKNSIYLNNIVNQLNIDNNNSDEYYNLCKLIIPKKINKTFQIHYKIWRTEQINRVNKYINSLPQLHIYQG